MYIISYIYILNMTYNVYIIYFLYTEAPPIGRLQLPWPHGHGELARAPEHGAAQAAQALELRGRVEGRRYRLYRSYIVLIVYIYGI